jgi:hypothetical protein
MSILDSGPAVRALIESAAAAQIARDAVDATLLFKRLAPGLRLTDLAPPDKRGEIETLLAAVRTRAEESFREWAARREIPEVEVRLGVEAYERCAGSEMEGVLRDLTPAATPRETLEKAIKQAAANCEHLQEDLVARDVGWALIKAALAAAEAYGDPLRELALRPRR